MNETIMILRKVKVNEVVNYRAHSGAVVKALLDGDDREYDEMTILSEFYEVGEDGSKKLLHQDSDTLIKVGRGFEGHTDGRGIVCFNLSEDDRQFSELNVYIDGFDGVYMVGIKPTPNVHRIILD